MAKSEELFSNIFLRYEVASGIVDSDEEISSENDNVKMLVKLGLAFTDYHKLY